MATPKSKITLLQPQGFGQIAEDDAFGLIGSLQATDSDPNTALTWSLNKGTSAYGSMALDTAGHWTYGLNPSSAKLNSLANGETATDVFVAKVVDSNGAVALQDIAITITGFNDAPMFVSGGQAVGTAAEDSAVKTTGRLKAKDVDHGATLTWSVLGDGIGSYGALSVDQTGKWSYAIDNNKADVQALAKGEKATDTFTVQVFDEYGASATQLVSINVVGREDRPVITGDVAGAVKEDFTLTAGGQLAAADPDHGATLTWSVSNKGVGKYGTFVLEQDGHWTYALNNASAKVQALNDGQSVTDSFVVRVSDGQGGTAAKTVNVTVAGSAEGSAVLAVADQSSTGENQPVTIDVLANDSGSGLSVIDATGPAGQGLVSVVGNKLVFDPGADFDYLALGQSAEVIATYTVRDQFGSTATAGAKITVAGENDTASIVGPATGAVAEDGTVSAGGTLAVVDADSGEAHFQAPASVAGNYGTFSFDTATGAWGYTLDNAAAQALTDGDLVQDKLTVTSADGTASQVIDVAISGANDAPTVANMPLDQNAAENNPFAFTLPADVFADIDTGDTLSLAASLADGSPLPAWLSFDPATGQFSGTPAVGDAAQLAVNVTATDGGGASASAAFNLTVAQAAVVNPGGPFTVIDPAQSGALASQIAGAILGSQPGLTIDATSLSMTAGAASVMFYDGSLSPLGIGPGLLITSGTMPGTSNTVGYFGADNAMPGNPALDAVVNTVFNTVSYDATMISFTFTVTDPAMTGVKFNAVFGSDEFPEWVNQFVDIGVVLVNGANVAYFNNDPMAPLSVIGSNLAANYFNDNTGNLSTPSFGGIAMPGIPSALPIEYDGISNVLSIFAPVHQGVNTIEIGIADTGDHVYDSGLFISNLIATNMPTSGVVLDVPCTDGNDDVAGTDASEVFDAKGGDDIIFAAGGNDVVLGGSGNDHLDGGSGDDEIDGGMGDDVIAAGGGNDTIHHEQGFDQIDGGSGFDVLKLDYAASNVGQAVTFGQALSDGTTVTHVESLEFHGGSGHDVVIGGDNADSIVGGAGDDTFTGGGGNDALAGGDGIDTAVFGGNAAGYDVVNVSTGVYQVSDLSGGSPDGIDTLSGIEFLQFADQLIDLSFSASSGVTIQGGSADDVINLLQTVPSQPLPTNFGDTIHGGDGDDRITAGAGADKLYGDAGNDQIKGGDGDDIIVGGAGHDEMEGGHGADSFVLDNLLDSSALVGGWDQIRSFRPDQGDRIDLRAIDAIAGGNDDGFTLVSAFSNEAGQLVEVKVDGGYLVQGDVNGDSVADFAINVETVVKLAVTDFWM